MKNKEDIYKIMTIVFIIDQGIKLSVRKNLVLQKVVTIIPKFFSLCYVENTGAAFSILKNNTVLLTVFSAVILAILERTIKKTKTFSKLEIISYGLLTGGILGNMLDRLIYHAVTDYLSFTFFSYQFPIFNFADMAITIGVILLLIDTFQEKEKGKEIEEKDLIKNLKLKKERKSKNESHRKI